MKLPLQAKPTARTRTTGRVADAVTPSGCCLNVCTPLGCHCVAEAPFC